MNIRTELLKDPLLFTSYFFKALNGSDFIIAEHHRLIANKLSKVLAMECPRLIINIAPRFGKTELVVKNFMAMGLAFNPKSKFIHTSYSEKLAVDNSDAVRNLVKSEEFQRIYPIGVSKESDSKSKWYTEEGGGIYATSTGGQITGFGAGSIDSDIFSGAIVIDDPIKPEDAISIVGREAVNERFDNTLRSRLNSQKTPIIIIMQRLHAHDLTGYLLEKEGDKWDVLTLPALKEDGTSLWSYKMPVEELYALRRINPFVYYSQYQQDPREVQAGGEFLKSFDIQKHVKPAFIDVNEPIHVSIDSNVYPYIAITIWQMRKRADGWDIIQIDELPAKDPNNTASAAGRQLVNRLKRKEFNAGIFIYGDPTTRARNNIDDNKKSFLDKLLDEVKKSYTVYDKMMRSAPPVSTSGDFVNAILAEEYAGLKITVDESCKTSISDYISTKQDKDGGVLKKRITDPKTGISYEPNGHLLDTLRYCLVSCFNEDYTKYVNRFSSPDNYMSVRRESIW